MLFLAVLVSPLMFLELGFGDPSGPGPGVRLQGPNKEENGDDKAGKGHVFHGKNSEAG